MSDTVFTKVDYDLGTLVKYIELGEIGLPDIVIHSSNCWYALGNQQLQVISLLSDVP